MSLNDKIDPMPEQTANELFEVIKKAHNIANESNEKMDLLVNSVKKYCILRIQEYALNCVYLTFIYTEKMNKATFITRWYWKKKLNKAEVKLEKIEKYLQELKKNIEL